MEISNLASVRFLIVMRRIIRVSIASWMLLFLSGEGFYHRNVQIQLGHLVAGRQFNFLNWTVQEVAETAAQAVSDPQNYLSTGVRSQIVKDYFELLGNALDIQSDIEQAYADPEITDAVSTTKVASAELQAIRDQLTTMQPLAENILQEHISGTLIHEGFGVMGWLMPPVTFRVTQLPEQMVVSPRDRIELVATISLSPRLGLQEHVELEERVDKRLGMASVVLPIAGLSTFPAMVYETSDLIHVVEIGAHEWVHLYLATRPLGLAYDSSPEMRTMNETTANIVGKAIGSRLIERYFPEEALRSAKEIQDPDAAIDYPESFNFRREMWETRVRTEELLSEGHIEHAETYMEERRSLFLDHGYRIRKLNQAYLAFHGAYADEPGAAGKDLIGPAVVELWEHCNSIRDFVIAMSGVTSFGDLEAILDSDQCFGA